MNRRRAELIRKNIRGELSEGERKEYETLQRLSLARVEALLSRQGKTSGGDDLSQGNRDGLTDFDT
jgi:hypothetical protein